MTSTLETRQDTPPERPLRRRGDELRSRDHVARIGLHAALFAGLVVMFGPFIWMALSSFKTEGEIRSDPPTFLPQNGTVDNYHTLFTRLDFPTFFTNSIVVAVLTTVGNLLFCSAAGYALAKLTFPGKRVLLLIVLGTIMVPSVVTMVPLFVLSSNLGLVNSLAGLILPFLAQAFGVFLMRQFIMSIPDDLLEAARIDGAGELRIFWQIVLPLCRPALAALSVLQVTWVYNNFFWAVAFMRTGDKLPVTSSLQNLRGQFFTDYNLLSAGSVIVAIPTLVIFFVLQRHLRAGLTLGATKG